MTNKKAFNWFLSHGKQRLVYYFFCLFLFFNSAERTNFEKQIDVSQSNIRETAVTVNKIEREEYCRAYGLAQL